jgi:phosphatidylserine decarboxylase
VKLLKIDMSDFQKASKYSSLNRLFTRELQKSRTFSEDENVVISPTDSQITAFGKIEDNTALQIKGMEYSVEGLLGKKDEKLDGGQFINFYLSPRDYHHYHTPLSGEIRKIVHFRGKLYPVNTPYLKRKENLFIENERVVLEIVTDSGKMVYMVLVGALNVGKIKIHLEPDLQTNLEDGERVAIFDYSENPKQITKGVDLGYFEMGSTVVLLFEREFIEPSISLSQKVKFGNIIAEVVSG